MPEYVPPVKPEPAPVEPEPAPGPDLNVLLETERQKNVDAAARLDTQRAEYDERMATLSSILRDKFEGRQAPTEPGPSPVSDEDFLTPEGARRAAERLAEEKATQAASQLDAAYRGTFTQMLEDQFDSKLEALKTRPYFKYIEKDLNDAIKANPKLRMAPRALDLLYNSFVGAKSTEIVEAEKTPKEPVIPEASAPMSRVSPRQAPAPAGGPRESGNEPTAHLSATEELMRQEYTKYGVKISPERWSEIRSALTGRDDIPQMEERRG